MRSRLRMAALAIVAAVASAPPAPAGDSAVENTVNLDLRVSGLGRDGCTVRIKPAHKSCEFQAFEKTIDASEMADPLRLDTIAIKAKSTGADRDCSFLITIEEPGRTPWTFRRGLRLNPRSAGDAAPRLSQTWHLNTATIAAKDQTDKRRR